MKFRVIFALAVTVVSAGCSSLSDKPTSQPRSAAWSDDTTQPASLINHLPEDTLLYARLPSLMAFTGAPKPNAMGELLDSDANEAALQQIFTGMRTELNALGQEGKLADLFLERLRSPLEVAVRLPKGAGITASEIYASARLDFESREAFQQQLTELVKFGPSLRLHSLATDEAPGFMSLGVMPAYYQYNAENKRFTLVAGFSASAELLTRINQAPVNRKHSAVLRQAEMEDSGYGLYVWANARVALPQITAFIPPEELADFRESGMLTVEEIAFAIGTAQGRGQISAYASGTEGALWDLSLPPAEASQLTTLGQPEILFSMNLPGNEWLNQIMALTGEDTRALNSELASYGFSIESILDGMNGRLSIIKDKAGRYIALEPKKPEAFAQLVNQMAEAGLINTTQNDYQGHSIEHWQFPLSKLMEFEQTPGWQMLARSQNSHYWVTRNKDVWLMAPIPQMLMTRIDQEPDFKVSPWLATEGEPDTDRSLVLIGSFDQRVQTNYHYYLEFLQVLAETVNAPIDLMAFPPAYIEALPETSTASLSVTYQNNAIRLALGYENHLLDSVGGGLASIAALGILSSIAVPQYQEYVERAEEAAF